MSSFGVIAIILISLVVVICAVLIMACLREVVPTNMTHTVQSRRSTKVYGSSFETGNVYYKWPAWVPYFGVSVTVFSDAIFDIDLNNYNAFDRERIPFLVNVKAFFQVQDSSIVVKRVKTQEELKDQLTAILQGAVRRILSNQSLEEIMSARRTLSDAFTEEVTEQVTAWGVVPIKSIEFMDISDVSGSKVIHNITEKESTRILSESRIAIANNNLAAEQIEIETKRTSELSSIESDRLKAISLLEKDRDTRLAEERNLQTVADEKLVTSKKNLDIVRNEQLTRAQIDAEQVVIQQKQVNEVSILENKTSATNIRTLADARTYEAEQQSKATRLAGAAEAENIRLKLEAPVDADIKLAEKIAALPSYQQYLISKQAIDAEREIGIANANALVKADLKLVINSGDISKGIKGIGDIISPNAGAAAVGLLENLANSDIGKNIMSRISGMNTVAKTDE